MKRRNPPINMAVILAKSGNPGFKRYRAPCARSQNLIAGGSAPAPWDHFFCSAKRKPRKTRPPRSRRLSLALLAGIGARQLAGRTFPTCTRGAPVRRHGSPPDFHEYSVSPSDSNTGSLEYSRWGCGTRRALRGSENRTSRHPLFFLKSTLLWLQQCDVIGLNVYAHSSYLKIKSKYP